MYSKEEQRKLFDLSKQLLQSNNVGTTENATQLVTDLQKVIVYHEWRYYILNDPIISDFEYDQLFKKLESLEGTYPDLKTADSPTQRVSTDLTSDFPSVEHLVPMLSLANSYNAEDLKDFDTKSKN